MVASEISIRELKNMPALDWAFICRGQQLIPLVRVPENLKIESKDPCCHSAQGFRQHVDFFVIKRDMSVVYVTVSIQARALYRVALFLIVKGKMVSCEVSPQVL